MIKFKLSKNISLASIADSDEYIAPQQYSHDHYILYDKRRDKDFLINATVKYFIDKFSVPKTQTEMLAEIASDVQDDKTELKETCSAFFNFLCAKKILLPVDTDETFFSAAPLFKKGEKIKEDIIVLEVLSERQYIDIYRVINKASNRVYVIKLLNGNKIKDEKSYRKELSELEREYRILKNVDHVPMVCKAYSFDNEQEHFAYITLEYIRGKSLTDYLDQTKALNEEWCLRIIKSILEAFSLLHASNTIHGDIHSSNILVLRNKGIKIIDLGLSRNVEIEKNEVLNFGGVNFYMPPERINTSSLNKYLKEPDLYSDVYQIGLLIYLVLYNKLPFDGFIWEELAANIKGSNAIFPDVSFLNYAVSAKLVLVIQKCLHKVPGERYKNAIEILEDFKKLVLEENKTVSKSKG